MQARESGTTMSEDQSAQVKYKVHDGKEQRNDKKEDNDFTEKLQKKNSHAAR
jgi:hypothetical protein